MSAPSTTRPGIPWSLLLVLGGLSATPPLSIDMYLPSLPKIASDFAAPQSQVQLTLSACILGIALGQFLGGPVSDAMGRRRPLLVGVTGYIVFSLTCAVAPSVPVLIAGRFLQGLLGGVAVVISRAIVRDRAEGAEAARAFSLLVMVGGVAPVVAPVIGSFLASATSWRGIFMVQAGLGVAAAAAILLVLPETLPPSDRHSGELAETIATAARIVRDRRFVGYALTIGFCFGALFFYISSSSFVFQDSFGFSPKAYAGLFAANALGLMAVGRIGASLVRRYGASTLLWWGVTELLVGSIALCASLWLQLGLPGIFVSLLIANLSISLVSPNATALALDSYGKDAGTASAYLGVVQFAIAAVASPIAGVAGKTTKFSMAFGILAMGAAAFAVHLILCRRASPSPSITEPYGSAAVVPMPEQEV
jgi:DHA1 family bicyclomycin/chloramphenicol resistance-like MFS transporter